ncbi:hypothetical protein H7U19_10565 [Hyunsoonleella sp. SJ7]|uniref:Uncharacterized protein n=1 Tax=Hyunsoonleella aquatilis TaxID=2762758 RepID=A0A923HEN2_9FLAO|nr:hypothetical protein [Hyunsoonleella aquatilis]MBC3758848.1 hypothetical protein [Hyunsoonleella aquatilis]
MRKIILVLFILSSMCSLSQEELKFTYDSITKKLETPKIELKHNSEYKVLISGLNSAIYKSDIKIKSFIINSKTPETVKIIFPGISENSDVIGFSQLQFDESLFVGLDSLKLAELELIYNKLNRLFSEAERKFIALNNIKIQSDKLYKATLNQSNSEASIDALDDVKSQFGIPSTDPTTNLKSEILLYKSYIGKTEEIFKIWLEKLYVIDERIAERYAKLSSWKALSENENYNKYLSFIDKSIKAMDNLEPKTFKSKRDGVDINIKLINSYTNDTVYTKVFDYYSKGKLSFDFSSGFFYSNEVEQSYYLEKRDSLKNDILNEPKRDFDISFGALGHLSYKFSSDFKAGISMGASLSPLDGKTRYLLGLSAIFGKRNQLAINSGVSFVKLKILSDSVSNDEVGNYVDSSVTAVPTYEKVKSGFFIGISYNLTAKKKYD